MVELIKNEQKTIKKKLLNECQIELTNTYPKDKDLYWEIQQEKGKWVEYHKPDYKTDYNKYSKDSIKELEEINATMSVNIVATR